MEKIRHWLKMDALTVKCVGKVLSEIEKERTVERIVFFLDCIVQFDYLEDSFQVFYS